MRHEVHNGFMNLFMVGLCNSSLFYFGKVLKIWFTEGQPIINNGQAPPDAWSINVNPSEMFHAEIRKLEIPNTANVKVR